MDAAVPVYEQTDMLFTGSPRFSEPACSPANKTMV